VNETPRRPELELRHVAAAILRLTPAERRAAVKPLIAMIERIVSSGDAQRTDWDPR
jgi:hypothetical protein